MPKRVKKLTLSKETLRLLQDPDLRLVAGGGFQPHGHWIATGGDANSCPNCITPQGGIVAMQQMQGNQAMNLPGFWLETPLHP